MAKNKVYRQGSVAGSGYKGLEVEGGSAKNQQNKVKQGYAGYSGLTGHESAEGPKAKSRRVYIELSTIYLYS